MAFLPKQIDLDVEGPASPGKRHDFYSLRGFFKIKPFSPPATIQNKNDFHLRHLNRDFAVFHLTFIHIECVTYLPSFLIIPILVSKHLLIVSYDTLKASANFNRVWVKSSSNNSFNCSSSLYCVFIWFFTQCGWIMAILRCSFSNVLANADEPALAWCTLAWMQLRAMC